MPHRRPNSRKAAVLIAAASLLALTTISAVPTPAQAASRHVGLTQDNPTGSPVGVRLNATDAADVGILNATTLRAPARDPFTGLHAGQIVIVPRGDQVTVRRIDEVQPDNHGSVLIVGAEMSMLDLAEYLDVDMHWDEGDLLSSSTRRHSARPEPSKSGSGVGEGVKFTLTDIDEEILLGDENSKYVKGWVKMQNSLDLDLKIDGGVLPLRATATATATLDSKTEIGLEVGGAGEWSQEVPIGTKQDLTCQVLPYGLGRVCPTVELSIYAEAQAGVTGTATATWNPRVGAYVKVSNSGVDYGSTPGYGYGIKKDWQITGNLAVKVTPLIDADFHYMTHSGPSLGIKAGPFLKFSADTTADPWWALTWGLNASFEVDGGSWLNKEYESPLYEIWEDQKPLFSAPGKFDGIVIDPAYLTVPRGTSHPLEAHTNGQTQDTAYTWTVPPGSGSLSSTTGKAVTYTAPARAGYYQVQVKGSATADPAYVMVDVPPDLPGAPTSVTATPGVRLAEVTFKAPDTGGAPITGVQVRESGNPGSLINSAPRKSYAMLDLPAKKATQIEVRIANRAGWSPWAASNEVTPHGPTVMSTPRRLQEHVSHLDVSADAQTIAYLKADDNGTASAPIQVKNLKTGKVSTASVTDEGILRVHYDAFALDPTGRYVAFAVEDHIWVRDLAKKTTRDWRAKCGESWWGTAPTDLDFAGGVLTYVCGHNKNAAMYYATDNGRKHVLVSDRADSYSGRSNMVSVDGRVLAWIEFAVPEDRNGDGKVDYNDTAWDLARRDMSTGQTTHYLLPLRGEATYGGGHDALALSADGSTFAVTYLNTTGVIYTGRFAKDGTVRTLTMRAIAIHEWSGYDDNVALSEDGTMLALFAGSEGYRRDAAITFYDARSAWVTRQEVCRYNESDTYSDNGYTWGAEVSIRKGKVYFGCSATDSPTPATGLYRAKLTEMSG